MTIRMKILKHVYGKNRNIDLYALSERKYRKSTNGGIKSL